MTTCLWTIETIKDAKFILSFCTPGVSKLPIIDQELVAGEGAHRPIERRARVRPLARAQRHLSETGCEDDDDISVLVWESCCELVCITRLAVRPLSEEQNKSAFEPIKSKTRYR